LHNTIRTSAAHAQHDHHRQWLLAGSSPAFGKIEAVIVYNNNPRWPSRLSPAKVAEALPANLFTVVLEHFQTDTAMPTTCCQPPQQLGSSTYSHVLLNRPAIAPISQAWPNTQIFRTLAAKMG
jgi:anaerobic selenocysteine-containing dehydrogenase